MPTTQPHLEITDGTTSIKIMDSSLTTAAQIATLSYRLTYGDWAPKIAKRNKSMLGLPYMPVLEEMTIDVRGSTAATAVSNLQTLNAMLDQAERWWNGELVSPVVIKYQPKGSNLTTQLQDVIIGRGFNDQTDMISLPGDFNKIGDDYFIHGVKLAFWRRNGLWIGASETVNKTTAAPTSLYAYTTFTDFPNQLAPFDLLFLNASGTVESASGNPSGIIATAAKSTYFLLYEGAQGVTALSLSGTTNTADVAAQATNGAVGRVAITAVEVSFSASSPGAATNKTNETEYVAIYMSCRLSASAVVTARAQIGFYVVGATEVTLPEVTITYNGGKPQVVFVGLFPSDALVFNHIDVYLRTDGAAINFDIDQFVVIGVNRETNILALPNITALASVNNAVKGLLLTRPKPFVGRPSASGDIRYPYSGNAYFFAGANRTVKDIYLLLFFVNGSYWQVVDQGTHLALQFTNSITRYLGYLTPE